MKLNITEQELTELLSEIEKGCESYIQEYYSGKYTDEEIVYGEQHWRGVKVGAQLLCKDILNTIKYKNLVGSENSVTL